MGPSPSPEPVDATAAGRLIDLADGAVVDGLEGRSPTAPVLAELPVALHRERAAFVTLRVDGALNGCIGAIEPAGSLAHTTVRMAWAAAFEDPRLPRLRADEYDRLHIEVSVLSPLSRLDVSSREELLDALRPGIDGLVVDAARRRAAFLPSVWEQLPEPAVFLDHLQLKAGIRPGTWPRRMVARRFTADEVGGRARRRTRRDACP